MSEESLVRQLLTSSQCEVCGQNYNELNINVLFHFDETWILKVFCDGCHSQVLLAAKIDEGNRSVSTTIKKYTDLMDHEIDTFKDVTIANDDFLDMYLFLDSFEGDITGLLGD